MHRNNMIVCVIFYILMIFPKSRFRRNPEKGFLLANTYLLELLYSWMLAVYVGPHSTPVVRLFFFQGPVKKNTVARLTSWTATSFPSLYRASGRVRHPEQIGIFQGDAVTHSVPEVELSHAYNPGLGR
jgi:hypothetical protein